MAALSLTYSFTIQLSKSVLLVTALVQDWRIIIPRHGNLQHDVLEGVLCEWRWTRMFLEHTAQELQKRQRCGFADVYWLRSDRVV